jgi:hypothetical protein
MSTRLSPPLEALEARLAPALIALAGFDPGDANWSLGSDTAFKDLEYTDVPLFNTTGKITQLGFVNVSGADPIVGAGLGGALVDTFYIQLGTGDALRTYSSGGAYTEFIKVNSGNVLAFFQDFNNDNELQNNELTGLSLGNNADVRVLGSIDGDVVANYNDLTKTVAATGLVSDKQAIRKLFVSGDINGSIIAGGAISSVTVDGDVESIRTGSAANGFAYDFNGIGALGGAVVAFTPPAKTVGGAISTVAVSSIQSIQAGNGGTSAAGGAISKITISNDTDGFLIQAGQGGAGIVSSTLGGAGGKVTDILVKVTDNDGTNLDAITITGGDGGDAFAGSTGTGGAGGSVERSYIGFDSVLGTKQVVSTFKLQDIVNVTGGEGGSGRTGGAGGLVKDVRAVVSTVYAGPVIMVAGGDGGAVTAAGGKGGLGGSVESLFLQNLSEAAVNSRIMVQAGDGGTNGGIGDGGSGGLVKTGTFSTFNLGVYAGDGAASLKAGGAGGSITGLKSEIAGQVFLRSMYLFGGDGGQGAAGAGGNGGSLSTLTFNASDLLGNSFIYAGSGGQSTGNFKGGNGGALSLLQVSDASNANDAFFLASAGAGGNGGTGGGLGGNTSSVTFLGRDTEVYLYAGSGGNATVNGNGGSGGRVDKVAVSALARAAETVEARILSGTGGNGAGVRGGGAFGGDMLTVNLAVTGVGRVVAGDGGNATGTGTPGNGGSLSTASVVSSSAAGDIFLLAGSAGTGTGGSALGGSITNNIAFGNGSITVQSGDGSGGGAGGNINGLGFGNFNQTGGSTGDVFITAGNGSAAATRAGVGGSITKVNGYISEGPGPTLTQIQAGDGGGGFGTGANGGSISTLYIIGGGNADATFVVAAGDGGNAPTGIRAGIGGSITSLAVSSALDDATLFRSVAAGDGGNAGGVNSTGGLGGSVTKLNVGHTIGDRSGVNFGFASMGGIFAGAGGTGTAKAGLAGNVTDVTANAIAAIVAGKTDSPRLVNLVDRVYLNGLTAIATNPDGSYANAATANHVGFSANPGAAGANVFSFAGGAPFNPNLGDTAIDGLIAALKLGTARNFAPTALLTGTDLAPVLVDNPNT